MLLAWVTLSANLSGMARHFLQLAQEIVAARRQPPASAQEALANAAMALEGARERMLALLDQAWAQAEASTGGAPGISVALDNQLREASMALVIAARRAVGDIYPYCGLRAAQEDADINRVWRDFHTASQHALFCP
jgi:hypothetical protein